MSTKELGKYGEDIAVNYLKKNGYKILDRNYVKIWEGKQRGEIDIVAKNKGIISFIEVKTQGSESAFLPEDKVDYKKRKKLIKMGQIWLSEKKIPLDSNWQIDVISILIDRETKKAKIRHFKNAVEDID